MWLSSADWMSRNMLRRIEIAWPITDAAMQTRIMQECITPYLIDTEDAWLLAQTGDYQQVSHTIKNTFSAQKGLIKQYANG